MKKKLRIFFDKYIVFVYMFGVMLFIMLPAVLWNGSDDIFHSPAAQQMNILDWIVWRATTWQPRLISDFLTAVFSYNLPIWKLFTSLAVTLLLFFICKFAVYSNNLQSAKSVHLITCCSFFLMMPFVISSSVCWYTGSFHYLWPTLFLMIALLPFYYLAIGYNLENRFFQYISIVCSSLVMYNEQPAAIFICFGLYTFIILLVQKEIIPKIFILSYVLAIINFIIYFLLGGTGIRRESEMHWYKEYPMLTLIDRFFQGVNWANYNILNGSNVLMLVLTVMIFILVVYKFHSKIVKVLSAIPVIVVMFSVVPFDYVFSRFSNEQVYLTTEYNLSVGNFIKTVLNPMLSNPANFNLNKSDLFPSFFCLCIILYVAGLIFVVFDNKRQGITNAVLYFAALFSAYSLSFSPTIFASGNRIFFITNVLFVVLISSLTSELSKYVDFSKNKMANFILILLMFISSIFIFEQFYLNFTGGCRY